MNKAVLLFRRMPFLRLLFPLVAGIVVGRYLLPYDGYGTLSLFFLGGMVVIAAIPFFSRSYRCRWLFGSFLFLQLFTLGAYRMVSARSALKELSPQDSTILLAELLEKPLEKANSYAVEVEVKRVEATRCSYRLFLYVEKDTLSSSLTRGDEILFPSALYRKKALNPGEFDYEAFLQLKGISGSCYLPKGKWRRSGHTERFSLRALALDFQHALIDKLTRYGVEGQELALVSAMVLGNRDNMDTELRNSYSATGASHILAVSGLHVGVVFFVLDFVLKFLFRSRFRSLRILLLLTALWMYAFVTGLPASVVRASFMLSLVCVGKWLDRSSSVFNTVSISAFFMLLYNPFYLFDVGFQLSYAAVFSILFFQPKIKAFYTSDHKRVEAVWSLTTVSLAAQLGTMPIALYHFHQFSSYFWLSGLWVVPLSSVVIYLTLFFFLLPEVELLCVAVANLLSGVAWLMNAGVSWMEKLPYALFEGIRFGGVEVFVSYVLIGVLALLLLKQNFRWMRIFLFSLALLVWVWSINGVWVSRREGVAVYNIKGVSAVNRYGMGRNELSCRGDYELVRKSVAPFWVEHNFPPVTLSQRSFFRVGDFSLYCLRDTFWNGRVGQVPFPVDVLVLGNDAVSSLENLTDLFSFRLLVLDSSNSRRFRKRIYQACSANNVACWDVAEQGAWVMEP
ncbi:MAG: ComEC/Rec2 family competence protein [Paludibacteraceae bacterium]|nr:ComEC/Rec2 family competence protein [Paludibacteraceae bacterium]